jgi:transposase
MDRGSAAKIGGMDRQTLRDWVHRFNAAGPDGLIDNWTDGPRPRLSAEQLAEFAVVVEAGPDREKDGVVRWRRVDLKRVIAERFGVEFHERYVGKLLKKLGFSHMSVRPRHPGQDERIVEAFKTYGPPRLQRGLSRLAADQSASTYPASRNRLRPRWRYARSGPHKTPGVRSRRFLNQDSEAPFDCQAIPSSPSRKPHRSISV